MGKGPEPALPSTPPAVGAQGKLAQEEPKKNRGELKPGDSFSSQENTYISCFHFNDDPKNFCKQAYLF